MNQNKKHRNLQSITTGEFGIFRDSNKGLAIFIKALNFWLLFFQEKSD